MNPGCTVLSRHPFRFSSALSNKGGMRLDVLKPASTRNDGDTLKALLIYPEFPDTFWSFRHALKFIHKKAAFPPLGLLTLGAMLPRNWDLRLIDMNVTTVAEKDLEWADIAFISGMSIQRRSARQIIARCRESGVRTVAGGPLFTSEYE